MKTQATNKIQRLKLLHSSKCLAASNEMPQWMKYSHIHNHWVTRFKIKKVTFNGNYGIRGQRNEAIHRFSQKTVKDFYIIQENMTSDRIYFDSENKKSIFISDIHFGLSYEFTEKSPNKNSLKHIYCHNRWVLNLKIYHFPEKTASNTPMRKYFLIKIHLIELTFYTKPRIEWDFKRRYNLE